MYIIFVSNTLHCLTRNIELPLEEIIDVSFSTTLPPPQKKTNKKTPKNKKQNKWNDFHTPVGVSKGDVK